MPYMITFFVEFSEDTPTTFRKEKLVTWFNNTYWEDSVNQQRALELIKKIKLAEPGARLLEFLKDEASSIPNLLNNKNASEDTRFYDAIERIYTHYLHKFCSEMIYENRIDLQLMSFENNKKPWNNNRLSTSSLTDNDQKKSYIQAKNNLINNLKNGIWDEAINLKRALVFLRQIDSIDPTEMSTIKKSMSQVAYELELEISKTQRDILLNHNNSFPDTHNDATHYFDFLIQMHQEYDMDLTPGLMFCNGLGGPNPRNIKERALYKKHEENYQGTNCLIL